LVNRINTNYGQSDQSRDRGCSLQRPSLCNSQVGSCNCFSEACSAFTHVMACTLAESAKLPSTPKAPTASLPLRAASIATGWSEPVPGRELHPLKSSAFHGALLRQQSRICVPTSGTLERSRASRT